MKAIRVYVAGPISKGDYLVNVRRAINAAHDLREEGFFPYIPHLSALWHFAIAREYEDWMIQDFEWISACHALFRLEGESPGADREVALAFQQQIPVFYSVAEIVTWRASKS